MNVRCFYLCRLSKILSCGFFRQLLVIAFVDENHQKKNKENLNIILNVFKKPTGFFRTGSFGHSPFGTIALKHIFLIKQCVGFTNRKWKHFTIFPMKIFLPCFETCGECSTQFHIVVLYICMTRGLARGDGKEQVVFFKTCFF